MSKTKTIEELVENEEIYGYPFSFIQADVTAARNIIRQITKMYFRGTQIPHDILREYYGQKGKLFSAASTLIKDQATIRKFRKKSEKAYAQFDSLQDYNGIAI
mgnify:CR=1 FL=1